MKTIQRNLFYLFFASALIINAQEDQNVKATKMGDGKFMSYVINESGGSYTYAGINGDPWTLTFKPYEETFKEILVKRDKFESNDQTYFPDEEAFPATYIKGMHNTEKVMAGWNYISYDKTRRMVILDEWVYFLEKWQDKDHYIINAVIKKGEIGGLKLMKKAMGAAKEMEKANHKENLQKYLDEAFKKQEELLPAWTANNRAKVEKRQAAKDRYKFTIDSVNGKYWNSAEGKKKLSEMRKDKVYLYNDSNTEFLFCHGQGVSTFLKPGQKYEFTCHSGKVFRGERIPNNNSNLKNTGQLLLNLEGNNCGTTYNASSFK